MRRGNIQVALFYIGVGGLGAGFFVVLATVLALAGMAPWLAGAGSYVLLTPLVYLGQHRFTFATNAEHRTALPRYVVLQVFGFTLAWLLPLLLANLFPTTVVFTVVAVFTAAMNFTLMKVWAFAPVKSGKAE